MPALVFVYGTLKAGFPNFHINAGVRVPGDFVTVDRLPLYIVSAKHIPWLVDRPGEGHTVTGQLFKVDEQTLADMDVLERITEAGWYTRRTIAVRPLDDATAAPLQALVYFGSADRLTSDLVQHGPLAEYTHAHSPHYRPDDAPAEG